MKKLSIDIVIPTYNRPDALNRTLEKIKLGNYHPNKIIIVDQTQNPIIIKEVLKILSNMKKTLNIEYISQDIPSLTKARNVGIKYVESEIVLCMDDDVDIKETTLIDLFKIFKDNKIALVAGIDENSTGYPRGGAYSLGYLFYKKSFKKKDIGHVTLSMFGRYPNDIKYRIKTEWAMGYFFAIRKSLVNRWNIMWDENLISYAYAEDLDFSFRYYRCCEREGLQCIVDPNIMVKHLATREWRVTSNKESFMLVMNRAYLNYKLMNNYKSFLAYNYTNLGILIEKIIKKDNPKDFLYFWLKSIKYRKELKKANIPYNLLN